MGMSFELNFTGAIDAMQKDRAERILKAIASIVKEYDGFIGEPTYSECRLKNLYKSKENPKPIRYEEIRLTGVLYSYYNEKRTQNKD